jgi:hypothetical protein
MTEAEWLNCANPEVMLKFVGGGVSERKLRLFICSCGRRVECFLKDEIARKVLDAVERYADGRIGDSTLYKWHRKAVAARDRFSRLHYMAPPWAAYQAVVEASVSPNDFSYLHAYFAWTNATYSVAKMAGRPWGGPLGMGDAAAQEESAELSEVLRDIVGNPFRPPPAIDPGWLGWQGGTVVRLAAGIYEGRRFAELPILADALEDAGCTDAEVLKHCRSGGEHARGCWLLDLLLSKS